MKNGERINRTLICLPLLPGESINMLALRLKQLACKAYPGVIMLDHNALSWVPIIFAKTVENGIKK